MIRPDQQPILVIGHRGMLGRDLLVRLQASGFAPVGLDLGKSISPAHPTLIPRWGITGRSW